MTQLDDASASETAAFAQALRIGPDVLTKIWAMRSSIVESFGAIVMALMGVPRYRHMSLADLQPQVLEPLIRDRIALAQPAGENVPELADIAGFAIWASVSDNVDAKIREQIKAGVWPVRLKPEDWTSGKINWLLDVIAPDRKVTGLVIANFKQVVQQGELRLHPLVAELPTPNLWKKTGVAE